MLRRLSDQYNRGLSVYVPRRVFSVFFVRVVFFRCLPSLPLVACCPRSPPVTRRARRMAASHAAAAAAADDDDDHRPCVACSSPSKRSASRYPHPGCKINCCNDCCASACFLWSSTHVLASGATLACTSTQTSNPPDWASSTARGRQNNIAQLLGMLCRQERSSSPLSRKLTDQAAVRCVTRPRAQARCHTPHLHDWAGSPCRHRHRHRRCRRKWYAPLRQYFDSWSVLLMNLDPSRLDLDRAATVERALYLYDRAKRSTDCYLGNATHCCVCVVFQFRSIS